jgi:hypothetical protein
LMRQRVARHPPAFLRKYPICSRFTHYLQLRLAIRGLLSRLRRSNTIAPIGTNHGAAGFP